MSALDTLKSSATIIAQKAQKPAIFHLSADNYIYSVKAFADPEGNNAYLPIEVDTEFTHPKTILGYEQKNHSPTITTQCRAITQDTGKILAHPDIREYSRHPVMESGFAVVDYLRLLGHDVELERDERIILGMPWIQIDLYAFFAVADFLRIVTGEYRNDVMSLCVASNNHSEGIIQGRRLYTYTKLKGEHLNYVKMPWIMTINGCKYLVRLCWYDTAAVHGNGGYQSFCANTGTPVDSKELFEKKDKPFMLRWYLERSEDFDKYALGDLKNHTALINNAKFFENIYKDIGLEKYYRKPRLTTGATVRDMIEGALAKECKPIHPDARPREIVNAYCANATASHLKKRTTTTAAYNAKVDGGRCRNNRPLDTLIRDVIADLDIAGCYGEGLRNQLYPLGNPVIIDYPTDAPQNEYLTLRQFIKRYGKELVPGAWQARVTLKDSDRLKYPQDFLMSWFPPKDISKMPTDTELGEVEDWWTIDNVGTSKVLTHQVNLALINHDFIQWLDNIASVRQRKEMYDNLLIVTAAYYPASERVNSVEELRALHDKFTGKNTCTIKKIRGRTTKISVSQECNAWYGVTLGDMFVTKLLLERAKHPKKTPLNELFKLCINTSYGDLVSPFFSVGNVIVGNNITARARALAWYMEKGLHGWETITDGCQFNINKVLYPNKKRVNGESIVRLYRGNPFANHDLVLKPLGNNEKIETIKDDTGKTGFLIFSGVETIRLDNAAAIQWVNETAMKHLQSLFPIVDVLHYNTIDLKGNTRTGQFGFEAKGIYEGAVFHGSGNYMFLIDGEYQKPKMRSYSRESQEIVKDNYKVTDPNHYIAKIFLVSLFENPQAVKRHTVFLKDRILKIGDFSRNYTNKYKGSVIFPGMTVKVASLLREFSLTQFTYKDIEQFRGWEKESDKLRKEYGQSYEMYFLNSDGSLNYQLMIQTIDDKITAGMISFWDGIDKRSAHGYRHQKDHPAKDKLENTKERLAEYYKYRPVIRCGKHVSDYDTDLEEILE